ncbi:MAG: BatA domain-containing protein [Planctomycetota bacterium]|nr:BatA domain-containing protein [Planctomycetota bacterium]
MASFLTIPLMFWLGLIAIASPIIIHLLNRRRFRVVEWAAMEFLLNANKKNQRRIQLEHIILLILRCIAIFLIGFLLARPFFPSDANFLGENQQFERIVVLDDSFSMNVRTGNKTIFDNAKDKVKEFVKVLSKDKSSNTLSVYLTSQIENPAVTQMDVTEDTLTEINDAIDEITCSDFPARFDSGLRAMVNATAGRQEGKNRVFYLVTDLRERDWWFSSQSEEGHPAQNLLKDIAENTPLGCYVVDVGDQVSEDLNLAITAMKPESPLSSGRENTFYVTVTNFGTSAVRDVRLEFYKNENAVADTEFISLIEPGQANSVTKSFPVRYSLDVPEFFEAADDIANRSKFWKVWAEVHVGDVSQDLVELDSKRFYAAEVKQGTSVLLIDGDPSAIEDRSETYYLRRAIRPVDSVSGFLPTVVGIGELSSVDFSRYQIVYLCNVDELSEGQLETIEEWVGDGGSLVLMLGDQINESIFNKQFYFDPVKAKALAESKNVNTRARLQGGSGLSPIRLIEMEGDVNQEEWVNLDLGESKSQITSVFEGQGNIAVSLVNFYSWWTSTETGLKPILEPVSPVMEAHHHYKFGPLHAESKVFASDPNSVSSGAEFRVFEVESKGVEIGAEFVVSDVVGQFERYPVKLTAGPGVKFSFEGQVSSELVLNKLPKQTDLEKHRYGCWRFKFSNGDVWMVTAEKAENVEDRGENTNVLARYNDESSQVAIAEKRYGKGRVVAFTFPGDEDWTNLPQIGSANIIMHMEMCEYLSVKESIESPSVGDGIAETIDISVVKTNAIIDPPKGEKRNVNAISTGTGEGKQAKYRKVTFPQMKDSGFYVMTLTNLEKIDGNEVTQTRIFAANVDAVEGDLKRLDFETVGDDYFGKNVKVISGPRMSSQTVQGARTEYWIFVLFLLGGILILEQFLGWLYGRRR